MAKRERGPAGEKIERFPHFLIAPCRRLISQRIRKRSIKNSQGRFVGPNVLNAYMTASEGKRGRAGRALCECGGLNVLDLGLSYNNERQKHKGETVWSEKKCTRRVRIFFLLVVRSPVQSTLSIPSHCVCCLSLSMSGGGVRLSDSGRDCTKTFLCQYVIDDLMREEPVISLVTRSLVN